MLPKSVQEALAAKGHELDIRNVKGVGSVKAILIDPRTGVLMGGVSPTGRQLRDGVVTIADCGFAEFQIVQIADDVDDAQATDAAMR